MTLILCESALHPACRVKCRHDDKALKKERKKGLRVRESPLLIGPELADNVRGNIVAAAFAPAAVRSRLSGVFQSVFQ